MLRELTWQNSVLSNKMWTVIYNEVLLFFPVPWRLRYNSGNEDTKNCEIIKSTIFLPLPKFHQNRGSETATSTIAMTTGV